MRSRAITLIVCFFVIDTGSTGSQDRDGCPSGATGVPLFTIWDSVAGLGRTPMPGNNSGRSHPGNSAVPFTVGRGTTGGGVRVGRPVGAR